MALLQIDKMTHYFGGLRAIYNYGLEIDHGQIRGLIEPNGAGKKPKAKRKPIICSK